MEKWKVVGYRSVNFKDQNTGKQVSGYSMFLARKPETPDIVGLEMQKIFISSDYVNYIPVENQMIGLSYNRYGKVQSIEVLG